MKSNWWPNIWRIGLGGSLVIAYGLWGKAAIQILFALTQGFEMTIPPGI